MATLPECQKAIREIRTQLNRLLGTSGSYKTSSSWSSVKYVTLKYYLGQGYNDAGEPGLFALDYDPDQIESIVNSVCDRYGIDPANQGVHMDELHIEINLYSDELR